ncbi:MAG: hypothetical protein C0521_06395 [Xanthomonas sp.]|nr:hypothetical protein [Xanthomonas sp.]
MNAPLADGSPYAITPADFVRDQDAVVDVWRSSLHDDQARALKLDWFYRHAPHAALLQVLVHQPSQAIVGTAGVGWRHMRLDGRALRGGLLADMAVMTGHRMLGPALLLQRTACEVALQVGDLVYGFPNPNAVPVVKRLGYVHVGDMTTYVRAVRHTSYLARRLPAALAGLLGTGIDRLVRLRDRLHRLTGRRLHAAWRTTPHETVHAQAWSSPGTLEGVHDRDALQWRFARCPLASFRFLYVRRDGDTQPCAWFVCRQDGDTLRVADFKTDPAGDASRSLAVLADSAFRLGCRSISLEGCLPEGEKALLRRHGFFVRQARPVYARWKQPDAAPRAAFRLTPFDEDE